MADLITLPALTLHPEWAWAICHLDKRVENRPESVARMLVKRGGWRRGSCIAIHAGKHIGGRAGTGAVYDALRLVQGMSWDAGWSSGSDYRKPLVDHFDFIRGDQKIRITTADITTSAVVAVARLGVLVHPDEARPWQAPGSWAVELAEVHVLARPVPCGGKQGLWPVQIPRELLPKWAMENVR